MRLTPKLLSFLNRVFDKDSKKFLALRFTHAGTMSWRVQDLRLTTATVYGVDLDIDLTQHTLASLAAFISTQDDYTVEFIDAARANLSARVLLDDTNSPTNSNGDHVYGYTSLLWAFLEAFSVELTAAGDAVAAAPRQLDTHTAEGFWLDEIGGYYKVPRLAGEVDALYGPRIIAEVLRPKSNNVALENAIKAYTGQDVTVTDVIDTSGGTNFYDGSATHNGAIDYDTSVTTRYCLFDVEYGYDVLNGGSFAEFAAVVRTVVDRLRAAGTHLRTLSLTSPAIGDSYSDPITDALDDFAAVLAVADAVDAPVEDFAAIQAIYKLTDDVGAPSESSTLTIGFGYLHDASRTYDGAIRYSGGLNPSGTIEG